METKVTIEGKKSGADWFHVQDSTADDQTSQNLLQMYRPQMILSRWQACE